MKLRREVRKDKLGKEGKVKNDLWEHGINWIRHRKGVDDK